KLFVATAAVGLLEEGRLTLGEKVCRILPDFRGPGRAAIRVRHLLTHTSGLPDLLPDDAEVRRRLAPLDEFRRRSLDVPLAFEPGRGAAYSSLGFLWLADVIHTVGGTPIDERLRQTLFAPLGMADTRLGPHGVDDDFDARRIDVELDDRQRLLGEGHWNSRYWLDLAAPWGGGFSTAGDLAVFARAVLAASRGADGNTGPGRPVLSSAAVETMLSDQLGPMPDVPEPERRCRPWGLGWQLFWPNHPRYFGDLLPPTAAGHGGANGTVLWLDRENDRFAVILTTRPVGGRSTHLARLSNAIAASFRR
ncbi:MAG: serine hydrolase domain-containing protein, partial [Planctomycetota bacterium]